MFQDEKGIPKKAVLLLNNAPLHPSESNKDSLTEKTKDDRLFVYYLPPNATSLIQPIDQGVSSFWNRRYNKIFVHFLLQKNFNN